MYNVLWLSCAWNGNDAGRSMDTARKLPVRCTNCSGKLFYDVYHIRQLNRTYSFVFLSTMVYCSKRENIKSSPVVIVCVQGVPTGLY